LHGTQFLSRDLSESHNFCQVQLVFYLLHLPWFSVKRWYFSIRQKLLSVNDEIVNIYPRSLQTTLLGSYLAETIHTVLKVY